MKINRFIVVVFMIWIFSIAGSFKLYSQALVRDSILIEFDTLQKIRSNVLIDSISDGRQVHPRSLGVSEKNKFLFIPVDLMLVTERPFADEIFKVIECPSAFSDFTRYHISIQYLRLRKITSSKIYPRYQLNASVNIFSNAGDGNDDFLGSFLYENTSGKKWFGDKSKQGYERVIRKWITNLVLDVNGLPKTGNNDQINKSYNFRKDLSPVKRINFFGGIDLITTNKGQVWDGEILFSPRETKRRFFRNGSSLRYRDCKAFESIEFGLSADYLFYRINPGIMFKAKSQLMIGFNKWNDLDTRKHNIWDAGIIDYSLSQIVSFNPIDRQSILFGIGLFENAYYIYSSAVKLSAGFLINLGIKL